MSISAAPRIAVYTAVTGGYDDVRPAPPSASCDFLCFTDAPVAIPGWTMRRIEDSELDSIRRAREVKIRAHRYLESYDISIWVDGSIEILRDPARLVASLDWTVPLHCYTHPARTSLADEADACIESGKGNPEMISRQLAHYQEEGCPMVGHLIESNVLARRHNDPGLIPAMEMWWDQVKQWSTRDQLGFGYAAWRSGLRYARMGGGNARGRSRYFRAHGHADAAGRNPVWLRGGLYEAARWLRNLRQPY